MKSIPIPFIFIVAMAFSTACGSKNKVELPTKDAAKPKKTESQANQDESQSKQPEGAFGQAGNHPPSTQNAPDVTINHTTWTYSGLTGPEMWGDLKPEYSSCKTGQHQSPIDLVWSRPKNPREIQMTYQESNYQLVDNGHTIKAVFEPGNYIRLGGKQYNLIQMHFHSQSEHTISGKQFPLEAHFVHADQSGHLAVLGVVFSEGRPNPFLDSMWEQFPKEKNRQVASTKAFNPNNLIPKVTTHYNYDGSLTTPPCSEGVNWSVFNTPLEVSREQLDHFRVLYANNFRPIQPKNGRKTQNY